MKILILSHLYPSHHNWNTGIFVHEQAKELSKQGCDVQVVSPIRSAPFPLNILSGKWKKYSETPLVNKIGGIQVSHPRYISFPKGLWFEYTGDLMYKGIKRKIEKLHEKHKFDLIHAHVALPDGYAAMKISKDLDIPYVLTIHGHDYYSTINKNNACKEKVLDALSNSSQSIFVSENLYNQQKNIWNSNKSCIIYNGVDRQFLKNREQTNNYFDKEMSPRLLSVSNLIERKGIEYNIRAVSTLIKKYPSLQYLIAGEGIEKDRLKKLVEELNLTKHISFLGQKSRQEVKQLMDECEVFSMPSWDEGFGLVYIEAMACGKPIIGCKGEGVKEIVTNCVNGFLVTPKSHEEISVVLDKLFSDTDYREQIGSKAKERVISTFTLESNVQKIIEVYNEVLKHN